MKIPTEKLTYVLYSIKCWREKMRKYEFFDHIKKDERIETNRWESVDDITQVKYSLWIID